MPSIIQDEKQAQALKEIEQKLMIVDSLNAALTEGTGFTIMANPSDGKTVKIDFIGKESEKLVAILCGYKKRLSKEILSKAEQYRIALSDKEKAGLSK